MVIQVLKQKIGSKLMVANLIGITIIVAGIITIGWLLYFHVPFGVDWFIFNSAVIKFISGKSPYETVGFYNPPWALIPLIPFSIIPQEIGRVMFSLIGIGSFLLVARKMGADILASVFLLVSPAVIRQLVDPNLDWMVALGFVLPPQIGIFFVMIKPQIGVGIAGYWLFESWGSGGFKKLLCDYLPISVVMILSFLLYGFWPLNTMGAANLTYNASLWPWSLPLGVGLLMLSVRMKRSDVAIISSPFMAPYFGLYSLHISALGLLPKRWLIAVFVIIMWVYFFIR
jgi:hypothetical protein